MINSSVPGWLEWFWSLIPILLYAETHYSFKGVYSRLKKKEPELIVDAPHRIEPGQDIPLLILLKDTDRFPTMVNSVNVKLILRNDLISSQTFPINSGVYRQKYAWHILNVLVPRQITGRLQLDVAVTFTCNGQTQTCHNDNYRLTSHAPLDVFAAADPMPRLPNWYYGDLHCHTSYSEDQVEFGSPIPATVRLSRALGLNFFAATDHSYDLDDQPDTFLKNDPELRKWKQYQAEIATSNKANSDFIILPGEEVSAGNAQNRNVHFLIINHPQFIPGKGDGAEKWFRTRPDLRIPKILNSVGSEVLAIAAHPEVRTPFLQWLFIRRGKWLWPDYQHTGLHGLQIWNGIRGPELRDGLKSWIRLLLAGKRRFIYGGTDAHGNFNRYRQISIPFFTMNEHHGQIFGSVRTAVFVDGDFTKANLIRALQQGRCIMTNGPLVDVFVTDTTGATYRMGETVNKPVSTINIRALSTAEYGSFERITLIVGDQTIGSEIAIHLLKPDDRALEIERSIPWHFSMDHPIYLRLEVTTMADDRNHFCYSNPIWLHF